MTWEQERRVNSKKPLNILTARPVFLLSFFLSLSLPSLATAAAATHFLSPPTSSRSLTAKQSKKKRLRWPLTQSNEIYSIGTGFIKAKWGQKVKIRHLRTKSESRHRRGLQEHHPNVRSSNAESPFFPTIIFNESGPNWIVFASSSAPLPSHSLLLTPNEIAAEEARAKAGNVRLRVSIAPERDKRGAKEELFRQELKKIFPFEFLWKFPI